jgi:hypothetical protein
LLKNEGMLDSDLSRVTFLATLEEQRSKRSGIGVCLINQRLDS